MHIVWVILRHEYRCLQCWRHERAVRIQQVALFYLPSIHQISSLEKTKFYQHSVLSSLMSKRLQQVSPFYRTSQFASSEEIDFRVWFSQSFLMQQKVARQEFFRCIERPNSSLVSILLWLFLRLKLFDFAVTLSSPETFCFLSDITSGHSVELKWLMLNKHKRWFHSSRVKFPLVSMSASWFLVSMYLIRILESRLIRSKNQSRATLWVLETCLNVGLLPFTIIWITASLSSNTYSKASWWEDWTFEGIKSTLSKSLITLWDCLRLWIVWGGEQASRLFNNGSSRSIMVLSCVPKDRDNQIP